jgi:hypothetical protein
MIGVLAGIAALVTLTSAGTAAAAAPRTAAAQAPVRMVTSTSLDEVRFSDGTRDTKPPFRGLAGGDVAFVRVSGRHDGGPRLPAGSAQLRLVLPDALAAAAITVSGRQGVRQCTRVDGVVVLCPITRPLRDGDRASVLLRIVIPQGLTDTALRLTGSVVRLARAEVRVRATPDPLTVKLYGFGPWTGGWRWEATWSGGSFTGHGMQLYQPPGADVICAAWSWSGGGGAWGHVVQGSWFATWYDDYGEGTWSLAIAAGGKSFSGTQDVEGTGPNPSFIAQILGTKTSDDVAALDCNAIRQEVFRSALRAGTGTHQLGR